MNLVSKENNRNYDVIIIGAGVVGLSFAHALARSPLRIAVIERGTKPAEFNSDQANDLRVFAINKASQRVWENLSLWSDIASTRISPIKAMQVWDQVSRAKIDFTSQLLADETLTHIIENNVLRSVLWQKASEQENIDLLAEHALDAINIDAEQATIMTSDQQTITAKLVVGADGARSWLRQQIGLPLSVKDYGQQAIVATIKTSLPHQKIARQSFLTTGPLAFLPLADPNLCSIVWSLDNNAAECILALPEAEFISELELAFEGALGNLELASKIVSFPLQGRHASDYVAQRVALLGDAAHTIHPLAGQGLNLGIMDAACLAEVLQQAVRKQKSIAELSVLEKYQRWREGHNAIMQKSMEGLLYLFQQQNPAITAVRGLGIATMNRLPFAKRLCMQFASGERRDLPELAR